MSRGPFKKKPGGQGRPARQPQRKKSKAERKKRAGPWATLGFAAAWVGACIAGVAYFIHESWKKAEVDRALLSAAQRRPLEFTEHSLCRMRCRHVSEEEVRATLEKGRINEKKSEKKLYPCPKLVVDAQVGKSRKNVQAVFSACPTHTGLVTVIDKDTDWVCIPECP